MIGQFWSFVVHFVFLVEIDTWNNPGEVYVDNRTLAVYPFATLGVNKLFGAIVVER